MITTTARAWIRSRDDYGRSVHYLRGVRTVGVVVKHPLMKAGEYGSYWYCRWDLPFDAPKDEKIVKFTSLKDAKAALEAATA